MQLISFNIEGFYRNSLYLQQLISELSPKLIFLQEIWVPYSEEANLNSVFPTYSVQISTPDQFTPVEDNLGISEHVWHGSALLWHESMGASVVNIKNVHERFTGIKIRVDGHSLLAISAYLPTSGKDDEYLDCLCQLSNFITDNTSVHDTVLIQVQMQTVQIDQLRAD